MSDIRILSFTFFLIFFLIALPIRVYLWLQIRKLSQGIKKGHTRILSKIADLFESKLSFGNNPFADKTAILETYYSELKFLGIGYDALGYFTRNLPNLLISIGLFGTFLGITLNLTDISTIIDNKGGEVSVVVENLQDPLQSMAIAFYSSLWAILFAALLTLVNFGFNIELEKEKLLNLLESFIEDDFSTQNNLDDRAIRLLTTALYGTDKKSDNIGHLIGEVLTTALYGQDTFPYEQNLEFVVNKVMATHYPNFINTIETFVSAITEFSEKIEIISESSDKFANSARDFERASIEIKGYSDALYEWRNKFADTQAQFLETTQHFSAQVDALLASNQEASKLAQQVYTTFAQSTKDFELSTRRYQDVSEKIENSQFPVKLAEASQNLEQFSAAAEVLQSNIQGMESMAKTMQNALDSLQVLSQETQVLNQHSDEIITLNKDRLIQEEKQLTKVEEKITTTADSIQLAAGELEQSTQTIKQLDLTFSSISQHLATLNTQSGDRLEVLSTIQENLTSLNRMHKKSLTEEVNQLQLLTQKHENLVNVIAQYQEKFDLSIKNIGGVIDTQLQGLNQLIPSSFSSISQNLAILNTQSGDHLEVLSTIQKNLTSSNQIQKKGLTEEVNQLRLLTQKHENLVNVIAQYQEKFNLTVKNLDGVIDTQLQGLSQSIPSSINTVSKESLNSIVNLIRENSNKYVDAFVLIEEQLKQMQVKQVILNTTLENLSGKISNNKSSNTVETNSEEETS